MAATWLAILIRISRYGDYMVKESELELVPNKPEGTKSNRLQVGISEPEISSYESTLAAK